jgi:hydroxymethylbilane synthase
VKLRIGSRGSRLALWQAEYARKNLLELADVDDVEIVVIQTTGDRITDVPLSQIGDKGLFTKELDRAVLDGVVDLAVHSLKDVPTRTADGLALAAVLERADARDALVVAPTMPRTLEALPAGARVGTSSLRRRAQLLALRADLVVEDLRGNLDTRLARVAAGDYDAAVLALAGISRLGAMDQVADVLDSPEWLPAPAQGALGVLARADDQPVRAILHRFDHAPTRRATAAERALLARLEGGCQIPIGAWCSGDSYLTLHGLVAAIDGSRVVRAQKMGSLHQPEKLGSDLADELIGLGAGDILAELRAARAPDAAAP